MEKVNISIERKIYRIEHRQWYYLNCFFVFQLNEFNLELSLFLKTVHTYIENVNETDDETIKLLAQTILAVDKLQNGSKHRETSFSNENRFFNNLNDEQFICRRHIVCRLCHVSNLTYSKQIVVFKPLVL